MIKHPHPSGRPIHRPHRIGRRIWNIPDVGPNVPRLRPKTKGIDAVGFLSTHLPGHQDYDWAHIAPQRGEAT